MKNKKILIVDDEEDILDLLEYNLAQSGFEVIRAEDGEKAVEQARIHKPDMVLLDIMMPKIDGVEACYRIRKLPGMKNAYIVFLTARSEEYSELAGFEAGADDYITKPIKPRVLLSRIKAIFRRELDGDSEDELRVLDLRIIRDEYLVRKGDKKINLPRKEFELLYFLASRPGKVYRREKLLEKVWGDVFVVDRTVDVHVRKLREKIGDDYIETVKGVGYKFRSDT